MKCHKGFERCSLSDFHRGPTFERWDCMMLSLLPSRSLVWSPPAWRSKGPSLMAFRRWIGMWFEGRSGGTHYTSVCSLSRVRVWTVSCFSIHTYIYIYVVSGFIRVYVFSTRKSGVLQEHLSFLAWFGWGIDGCALHVPGPPPMVWSPPPNIPASIGLLQGEVEPYRNVIPCLYL